MTMVEDGLEEQYRYICELCSFSANTEDDVVDHILDKHTKEELAFFCVKRMDTDEIHTGL